MQMPFHWAPSPAWTIYFRELTDVIEGLAGLKSAGQRPRQALVLQSWDWRCSEGRMYFSLWRRGRKYMRVLSLFSESFNFQRKKTFEQVCPHYFGGESALVRVYWLKYWSHLKKHLHNNIESVVWLKTEYPVLARFTHKFSHPAIYNLNFHK